MPGGNNSVHNMRGNNKAHNTRDRSTKDHSTRDRSNMCVSSTSSGCQSNGPNILYPRVCHHTENSRNGRNDGSGTDDVSDNNPQRHRCNPRRMSRNSRHHRHIHTWFHRHSCRARRWYHVYIRWVHRPVLSHPHTESDLFRMYNGGYTHRDHGQL